MGWWSDRAWGPHACRRLAPMRSKTGSGIGPALTVPNALESGAGEGNRTLVCSLGSCRSTIELHPHRHPVYGVSAPDAIRSFAFGPPIVHPNPMPAGPCRASNAIDGRRDLALTAQCRNIPGPRDLSGRIAAR